jgi:hypothetical protein
VTADLQTLHETLKRDWCDTFSAQTLPNGALTVVTPFLFGDGDGYPIVVEHGREGWRITDRGGVVSRFQLDEFDITEARHRQLEQFAAANGATLEGEVLSVALERAPQVEDIADFVELIARVSGLRLHVRAEPDSDQFRTRARTQIADWLREPQRAIPNWEPAQAHSRAFQADLWIPAQQRAVVAFFAGSTSKADHSIISIHQYRNWGLDVKPVFAHNGVLGSETLYRAALALDDDSALVKVDEQAPQTGYLGLRRVLATAGVGLN